MDLVLLSTGTYRRQHREDSIDSSWAVSPNSLYHQHVHGQQSARRGRYHRGKPLLFTCVKGRVVELPMRHSILARELHLCHSEGRALNGLWGIPRSCSPVEDTWSIRQNVPSHPSSSTFSCLQTSGRNATSWPAHHRVLPVKLLT